jgi:phage terminase small subunit
MLKEKKGYAEKKRNFLTAYIDTQNISEAARVANITQATGSRWAKKYSNMLEIQFEHLGLDRNTVLERHAQAIKEPPVKLKVTKQGVFKETDAAAHLKAIDMYYEITGIKKSSPAIVVVNDVSAESKAEIDIFKALPEETKKIVRDKIISMRAKSNANAQNKIFDSEGSEE